MRVVLSAYLRLLMFLPAILILACDLSSPVFLVMYSAYKLNKWVTTYSLTHSFLSFEPVCCSMFGSKGCSVTCIQVSQEAGKVVWYSYLFEEISILSHSIVFLYFFALFT